MASFKDICFTPAEFANLAKIERTQISALEEKGRLKTTKRKMGNVDRKMITLENMQNYFRELRTTGTASAAPAQDESVATATGFIPSLPKQKIQMFYNVKGGTGKSTLTAQYVMRAAMNSHG